MSASGFFDKVRALAFLKDTALQRDDYAPMMFAQSLLVQNQRFFLRLASSFSSLFSACYHGTSPPNEVWEKIRSQRFEFGPVFEVLAAVDNALTAAHVVNGVSALYRAWLIIKNDRILPLGLQRTRVIYLRHLVDLTSLEIEVIKDLSRRGLNFDICFPMDFQSRGINAAVDFSARLFEKSQDLENIELSFENIAKPGPLRPLVEALFTENTKVQISKKICSVENPYDIIDEAHQIGATVAKILTAVPDASIAVVVRSIDSRAKIYKNALQRFGISVRDRKGIPLLETDAGILLVTLLFARTWHLPKKNIISLINHPMFSLSVGDVSKKALILDCVRELGIDDRLMTSRVCRYQTAMENLRTVAKLSDGRKADLRDCEDWLNAVERLLALLPEKESFYGFLQIVSSLLEQAINQDDVNSLLLKSSVLELKTSSRRVKLGETISFNDFTSLIFAELARITVPRPDVLDVNAVEFLLLPELLGRSFDHVFIADISFGRMPQNSEPDPLIDDQARIALNGVFKKPLLRVFMDDPFEPLPVPPRQALEPFWFATAVAAAQSSVHLYCARYDENGAEQAPSEFFLWLKEHVQLTDTTESQTAAKLVRAVDFRFLEGLSERNDPNRKKSAYHQTLLARKTAFLDQDVSGTAFYFTEELILNRFDGRLNAQPTKALTPTMVEAFAECRFKGLAERLLSIKHGDAHEDIDARILGQVAHSALERYFGDFKPNPQSPFDRSRLIQIVDFVGKEFLANNFILHPELFFCHLEWLKDALFSLIHQMSREGFSQPLREVGGALELAFGSSSYWKMAANIHRRKWSTIS